MGRLSSPAPASLDRLKALDVLPDLKTQICEAQQLCNHSARAEMILRWLLPKLKSSEDARREPASWDLLSSTVRLLSKHKTAVLLGPLGFMDILCTTCADLGLPTGTIVALAHLLNLLLESTQQADGPAIQALLSIKGESAASICGPWLQHLYKTSMKPDADKSALVNTYLLNPALRIWDLRKRSVIDDELFNTNCLVPALLLLAHSNSVNLQHPNKRKRGHVSLESRSLRVLESLVAIHTIIPARSLFFETQDTPRKANCPPYPPALKERLGPLKMALLGGRFPHAVAAVPLVMEIALRSVSAPTPKQRVNERPWIETLLGVLESCMIGQGSDKISEMLATALESVRCHGLSISSHSLSELARKKALPTIQDTSTNWHLIVEIVRMDSTVYTEQSLADEVFAAIEDDQGTDLHPDFVSITSDVIVPIMRAFTKSRKAQELATIWRKQLLRTTKTSVNSIWKAIAVPFGEDLETALSYDQIDSLFDQLMLPIDAMAESTIRGDPVEWRENVVNLTLLYSIMCGIRSDELLERLYPKIDRLVQMLFGLKYVNGGRAPDEFLHQLFTLLTRAFDLWFANWTQQQARRAAVAQHGVRLFESSICLSARETLVAASNGESGCAARTLIATMCNAFQCYYEDEECIRIVAEHIRGLGESTGADSHIVFLKFPALLDILEPNQWGQIITGILKGKDDHSCRALAAIAAASKRDFLGATVPVVLKEVQGSADPLCLLQFLSCLDHTKFAQEQRTAVLDALLHLDTAALSVHERRLSLVLSLLPGARRDVQLLKEPSCIWRLAALHDTYKARPALTAVQETVGGTRILEDVACSVVEYWLSSKDHQWARETLTQFSKDVKEYIQKASREGTLGTQPGSCTIAKIAIVLLTSHIPPGYPEKLVHQDAKSTKLFMKALIDEAESLSSPANIMDRSHESGAPSLLFNVLVSMPQSIRQDACSKEMQERILTLAQQAASSQTTPNIGALQYSFDYLRVKHIYDGRTLESFTEQAGQALHLSLPATSHDQLLRTYAAAAQDASTAEKLAAVKQLASRLARFPEAVTLYRMLVANIDKDELDSTASLTNNGQVTGSELIMPVIRAALDTKSLPTTQAALKMLGSMVKQQPHLLNQQSVEVVLGTIQQLLISSKFATTIYTDACDVLAALFATQRARLQGRFHLLVAVFQAFFSALFRHPNQTGRSKAPVRHAKELVRLLESFCNPPLAHHRGTKTSELVDEARKAKADAGRYAQYILHHYCAQILSGSLGAGVREALKPGLSAMIDAIEVNNQEEGIKSLSAAMNNSERAVLRSVYDEWKTFGKWEGS